MAMVMPAMPAMWFRRFRRSTLKKTHFLNRNTFSDFRFYCVFERFRAF
jgi:hypothetical protein